MAPGARDPTRRARILAAAKEHFARHGWKGTNLDAVAADAGCAKGALYLEFSDKQALLREVVEQAFAGIRARFVEDVLTIASPLERLVGTLRFAHRQWAAEPLFAKLLREDPDLRALGLADDADAARAAKQQIDQLASWVDEGIALGEIRPDVDRAAIPFVIGVLRFAPQHTALGAQLGFFSGERTLDAIVDVFHRGLAAAPKTTRTRSATPARGRKRRKA